MTTANPSMSRCCAQRCNDSVEREGVGVPGTSGLGSIARPDAWGHGRMLDVSGIPSPELPTIAAAVPLEASAIFSVAGFIAVMCK